MRALVTGGAGYIGSHAARHLLESGAEAVVIVDSLERGHRGAVERLVAAFPGRVRLAELDLRDRAGLTALLAAERPDAVLHFAAYALVAESAERPAMYWSCGVGGTASLLEAMRAAGTPRLVFSSTAATYGTPETVPIPETARQRPVNPYGSCKLACEELVRGEVAAARADGRPLAATILRYFNVAGCSSDALLGEDHRPETHLIPSALEAALGRRPAIRVFGTDYPTADGTCVRDYVHVEDLAAAHALALGAQTAGTCDAYNVGNGTGHSVREVIAECERVTGCRIAIEDAGRRAGDPAVLVADTARIAERLGWRPRAGSLSAMVETAWRWMRANPGGYGG